ncbi:MAG: hypothetical protein GY906_19135, partial [bacterium]|nr:hypothetical protein [bacterium]
MGCRIRDQRRFTVWLQSLTWLVMLAAVACAPPGGGVEPAPVVDSPLWNADDVEIIQWQADLPNFNPDDAIEASGLAVSDSYLYLASEKYASLLQLPLDNPSTARVISLTVPPHSELEGLTLADDSLLVCDETHAAVYEVLIGDEAVLAEAKPGDSQLIATQLDLPDLGVVGGKLGFEGLAIDVKTGVIYLMLERSGDSSTGCRSTIYRLRRNGEALEEIAPPIELELENCTWRHTGLDFVSDKLVALKTSYPGFEYQIVEIDPQDGSSL